MPQFPLQRACPCRDIPVASRQGSGAPGRAGCWLEEGAGAIRCRCLHFPSLGGGAETGTAKVSRNTDGEFVSDPVCVMTEKTKVVWGCMRKMGETGGGLILSGEVGKNGRKVCCPFKGTGGSTSSEMGMGLRESPGGGRSLVPGAMRGVSGLHWFKALASVTAGA